VRSDSRFVCCDGFCSVGADERIAVGSPVNYLLHDTMWNVHMPLEDVGVVVN
jgi:hypothetical protein